MSAVDLTQRRCLYFCFLGRSNFRLLSCYPKLYLVHRVRDKGFIQFLFLSVFFRVHLTVPAKSRKYGIKKSYVSNKRSPDIHRKYSSQRKLKLLNLWLGFAGVSYHRKIEKCGLCFSCLF